MKIQILLLFALFMFCIVNSGTAQEVKINHNGTDGLAVESDGTLRVDGAATTWDDLRVPLNSAEKKLATDNDWIIGSRVLKIDWFADNSVNEMYFVAQMPHTYKEGTNIYPHIHWIGILDGSGTNRPRFGLEFAWVNLGETISGYTTIYGNSIKPDNTGNIVALTHYLTRFDENASGGDISNIGIVGTGKEISSMMVCRVFRDTGDPGDTYNHDVGLLEIDFHYEVNTMGSRAEFTK